MFDSSLTVIFATHRPLSYSGYSAIRHDTGHVCVGWHIRTFYDDVIFVLQIVISSRTNSETVNTQWRRKEWDWGV